MTPGGSSQGDIPKPFLSFVMPCLNEELTVGQCIDEAFSFLKETKQSGEVIVADNGSNDASRSIIQSKGAVLVDVKNKGYGNALRAGIAKARGQYIIMADSDASYHFGLAAPFLAELKAGADLVIGNRFQGGIAPGAMPPLHQYFGNPMMSWMGRLMFQLPLGDFHCGMRGIHKEHFHKLKLTATGMEFASELIVRTALLPGTIAEVPTKLRPDGRNRPPHLRSFRDGFRHLFLRMKYCSDWLLAYPALLGMLLSLGGLCFSPFLKTSLVGLFLSIQLFGLGTALTYSVAVSGIKIQCPVVRFIRPPTLIFMAASGLILATSEWTNLARNDSPWAFFVLWVLVAEFLFLSQLVFFISRRIKVEKSPSPKSPSPVTIPD